MAIIGISGKKQSGKDTVGKIIQYLMIENKYAGDDCVYNGFNSFIEHEYDLSLDYENNDCYWKIVKFADNLKSMMCIILGEPDFIEKWEASDNNYRDEELGEEWWYYKANNRPETELIPYLDVIEDKAYYTNNFILIKLTRRKLLQLLGTDCGRNIIHPNIWCISTFANYKPIQDNATGNRQPDDLDDCPMNFPNWIITDWIITDCRFPNEVKAIEDRDGFIIRCNRQMYSYLDDIISLQEVKYNIFKDTGEYPTKEYLNKYSKVDNNQHESETSLDNHKFKYTIDNNGTIEELIKQVKDILIKEGII